MYANTEVQLMHDEANQQFAITIDHYRPFIQYTRTGDLLVLEHTEVPIQLEGRGIGKMLAEKALSYIEEQGWKIVPLCPFMSSYIKRHPEWDRIVHHIL